MDIPIHEFRNITITPGILKLIAEIDEFKGRWKVQNREYRLVFFLRTMVKQKNNLAAKVREEQALRSSLPALSRQILEVAKTRGEITVKEIEKFTGANRNTVKARLRKMASDNYLAHVAKGRGAGYTLK